MKKYLLVVGVVLFYSLHLIGNVKAPVEEVDIIVGEGYDINIQGSSLDYLVPFNAYVFKLEEGKASVTTSGYGKSIEEAIESRSLKRDKKYVEGLEKVCFISETFARNGIGEFIANKFSRTSVNDMAYMVVVDGKSKDYIESKTKGYISAADYTAQLIKNIQNYNFFSDNYKIIDALVRVKSEGRQMVIPYAELKESHIEITGLAIFHEDKMVRKVDINDALALNMLRDEKVKGMLSLQKSPKEYTDFSATVKKRKIKCYKKNDQYIFDIELIVTGEVSSNDMYEGLMNNLEVKKKFEKDMGKHIEKLCNGFIEKMQNEFRVDCLELGSYGAAKFGRRKNIDWNEVVTNSKINLKVKVKVDKQGRGDY